MDRRTFLTLLGTTAVTGACQTGGSRETDQSQFKSQLLLPTNPDAPEKLLGKKRSAMIVGGGIAGLTAALKLAQRGYSVELREAAPYFGGRLHTRQERLSTGQFAVEHGLHMWFYQYYNFKKLLAELEVESNFRPFNEVYFHFNSYKPETIRSEGPYPLNLLKIVSDSPNLNLLNAAATWRALPDIMFYNHFSTPQKLDEKTFPEWAKETGISKAFYDVILNPAASVSLNDPAKISAAEMALMTHFYFISHPKAFHRQITTKDHASALVDPWVAKIRSLGVEMKTSSPVQSIEFLENGVKVDEKEFDYLILAADVPSSRKLLDNARVASPKMRPMVDVIKSSITNLREAPPYHILRVWLAGPVGRNRPDVQAVIETPESHPINLLVFFDKIEDESRAWAKANNGTVMEFHLYATPQFWGKSPDEIWQSIRPVAESVVPELKGVRALDMALGRFNNFTSLEAGQRKHRPQANTAQRAGVKSLYFAGDWVDCLSFPNSLMERAITTSLEAVNSILIADGVRQMTIEGANPHGPGVLPVF